jgi:DNA polymerase III alpha subunit (gram-positive type)
MDNIIFMDGEFAKLKANGIDLISIALIKPNGEELYLELEYDCEIDPWVKENVLPYLTSNKVSKENAVQQIREFVGLNKPTLIAHINAFDWMGICNLFDANSPEQIQSNLPFSWIPIDFESILFYRGLGGISLSNVAKRFDIEIVGNNHNALYDTRLLKAVYEKLE